MCSRLRRKMTRLTVGAILLLVHVSNICAKTLEIIETSTVLSTPEDDGFENNIIDFDEEYTVKFNKKYGAIPWHANDFTKNAHKYTIIKDTDTSNSKNVSYNPNITTNSINIREETTTEDVKVIPLELISTTENALISLIESTTEQDLTVIPLSTTVKLPSVEIVKSVTLPSTTTEYEVTTDISEITTSTDSSEQTTYYSNEDITTTWEPLYLKAENISLIALNDTKSSNKSSHVQEIAETTTENNNKKNRTSKISSKIKAPQTNVTITQNKTVKTSNNTDLKAENRSITIDGKDEDADVPIFTELDTEELDDIPEDYYDSKDVLPTSAPKTDAISVLFGLAGSVVESVVESVAERVVPKSIYDLFKRMQKQNEALEAERLRSREENGGIGQFGRGILKSLSSGLSRPLSQLMAGVKEAGSLDTDRGFVNNLASSVSSVASAANTYLDAFKDKVQAIYPGTVWCGDGHSAQARSSSDLGLFFFTDTCCRQHDACKIYIKAGETKYGLTNTGLFTRSHCSCDAKFRECLRRTNSLVSAQIGLTYFNVLGPQCFRRSHPIVKCTRRTRITGQKCEEYELDYTKPRMWQWFDNETF